jgi:hypothetical protein
MTTRRPLFCAMMMTTMMTIAGCVPIAAQVPSSVIEPSHASLVVGNSQAFQLLDREGQEIDAGQWSVSDPEIADLENDGAHVILTAKASGHVVLRSADGAEAAVDVVSEDVPEGWPPAQAHWTLRPIDGEFASVFWATGAWGGSAPDADPTADTDPAYFYEDRVPSARTDCRSGNGLPVIRRHFTWFAGTFTTASCFA